MKKLLSLVLALAMLLTLVPVAFAEEATETKSIAGKEYGVDYTSLYSQFGKQITIADVEEDEDTGLCYITVDGEEYELGLDFLTMAMVYNTTPAGDYETEDDVYAAWWRLYIQRWNYLLPEIPLYSNEYYDLYNAQIKGVEEHPTNPYWGPAEALIDWTSEKEDNSIIIGNTTDLSGKFRYATFGGTNPGAADLDIQNLTSGLSTVTTNKEGGYQFDDTVVKEHTEVDNEDGSRTYTITIYDDLKFSDGSPITAKNYLAFTMVFSSPVGAAAAGKDHMSGMQLLGFDTFNTYDGTEGSGTKEFAGLRLIDDYTFSITVDPNYMPYFYAIAYAGMTPYYLPMWIGDADIKDDGNGAYFTEEFYAKDGDKYTVADIISATALNTDTTYPYSGAYVVESYDSADKSAVLKKNEYYKGNYEGVVPSI